MNILHVITHGGWAGSESIAAAIANEQAKNGHKVTVVLRQNKEFSKKVIESNFEDSIKIFWTAQSETHPSNQINSLLKDDNFVNAVNELNVLHAHLPYGCLMGDMLKHKLSLNFLIFVSMHVRFHPLYELADKIFTVAKWQIEEIPKKHQEKAHTIENFLFIKEIDTQKKIKLFMRKHHLNDKEKYIFFLGRLDLVKGPDILIRAFNRLRPAGYKLVLIGDGPEMSALRKISSKEIIFAGKITDAACLLKLADITVVPSRFESFGLALLEAVNANTRIIASNIPSFTDILSDDKLLFENENVNSLSLKIKEYIENPNLGYADKLILEKYSISNSYEKLESIYLDQISNTEKNTNHLESSEHKMEVA
jgi:Glycosyltransferase